VSTRLAASAIISTVLVRVFFFISSSLSLCSSRIESMSFFFHPGQSYVSLSGRQVPFACLFNALIPYSTFGTGDWRHFSLKMFFGRIEASHMPPTLPPFSSIAIPYLTVKYPRIVRGYSTFRSRTNSSILDRSFLSKRSRSLSMPLSASFRNKERVSGSILPSGNV